jgi:hypothetical protein
MHQTQITEGEIKWLADIAASAVNVAYPSTAGAGVKYGDVSSAAPIPGGRRVHVKLDASWAAGTPALTVHLYGYDGTNWFYLGSMNQGSVINIDAKTHSPSATRIRRCESFEVSGRNYQRYATSLQDLAGTTPVVSTYIGFPLL